MTTKPAELFNANATVADDLGVDRTNKMIMGCKVMQLGELNDDRPYFADMQTLENVVDFMGQPKKGVKARFTHSAAMGGDGLNTHLGRWLNPRIDGDSVRADLQLADASEISPVGNLADFVLTLATEDPESFGVSVAGILDASMFEQEETIYPIRFSRIWSADFVGDPAATRGGLFSHHANLEEQPVAEELEKPIEELAPQEEVETPVEEQVVEACSEAVTVTDLRDDAKPYVEAFGNQGAAWFLEGKTIEDCFRQENKTLKDTLLEMHSQIEELVESLAKNDEANGESEPLSVAPAVNPETVAEATKRDKLQKLQKQGASQPVIAWSQLYNN